MLSMTTLRGLRALTAPAIAAFAFSACSDDDGVTRAAVETNTDNSVYGLAAQTSVTTTLTSAIDAAGLASVLQGDGPFTVFAPVNDAFQQDLAPEIFTALLDSENVNLLADVLTYHVVPGRITSDMLTDGQRVASVEGTELTISLDGGVQVNGANVITADIEGSNGVVHLIDAVLLESLNVVERATLTPGTATLATAVGAAGLAETLSGPGPFTVFAPVDAAFGDVDVADLLANTDLLSKVLTYHVVPGEVRAADLTSGMTATTVEGTQLSFDLSAGAKVNGANIIATDIGVENGVIHLVDAVLLENLNIVERAIATPATQTLQDAVIAAGLAETLSGPGPFTVFAPTNEAFAALPAGTLESLLLPENVGQLQSILTYHVLSGEVRAADLVDGQRPATVQGSEVQIDLSDGPKVNGANIVITDIETANGVIHVIDAVILPPS